MASEFDLPIVGLPKTPVSPAVAQTTALTQTPEEQPPTSEFDLPIVNKKPLDQQVTRIKKEEQIPFETLYKDPENLKVIREYGEVRFGESGKQKKGESDEDYAKRFMTAMRQVEWNTSLNAIPELNWINNAKPEEVVKASRAHNLYDKVPAWYEKGGQPGARPFGEALLSAVSEPTNILSAGIGATARYAVARQAIKNAISTKAKTAAVAGGAEAVIGVGQDVISQDIRMKTGVQDEFSYLQLGLSAGLSAFGGALEAVTAVGGKTKTSKKELEDKLAGKKVVKEEDAAT